MKILINPCFDGLVIPRKYAEWLVQNKGWTLGNNEMDMTPKYIYDEGINCDDGDDFYWSPDHRINSDIIEAVEALGNCSSCVVVEIPDGTDHDIVSVNHCREEIHEKHRVWTFKGRDELD